MGGRASQLKNAFMLKSAPLWQRKKESWPVPMGTDVYLLIALASSREARVTYLGLNMSSTNKLHILKFDVRGWKDGSAFKGACCSCPEPLLGSQHPHQMAHSHLQLQLQGYRHLLWDFVGSSTDICV